MSSRQSVASLLEENKNLSLNAKNKIVCSITGHEMPPKADIIISYLSSKKLQKKRDWYFIDFSHLLPHIAENQKNSKLLFCHLTKKSLSKNPDQILKHIGGKKFQRLKKEAEIKTKAWRERKISSKKEENGNESEESCDFWVISLFN